MNRNTRRTTSTCSRKNNRKSCGSGNCLCQDTRTGSTCRTGKALAEARLRGQNATVPPAETDTANIAPPQGAAASGTINEESRAVKTPSADEPPSEVVRKVKTTSDYFNTLSKNVREPKLIQAIIDENIKAVDGSRVRLRLLDDVEIGECVIARGTYLYATVSGFSSGRVKGNISSILVNDELVKVSLSLYDTDGMEGLYVPNSQFRETSKDVASGAMSGNMNMSMGSTTGNNLAQWGMQAVNNAYQKTSNAISKAIKKNKVKLKYGTFVYLVNGQEKGIKTMMTWKQIYQNITKVRMGFIMRTI